LFYAWRQEIAKRDAEQKRRGVHESQTVEQNRNCGRSTVTANRSAGGKARADAGLIAVEIVGDVASRLTVSPTTLEIECPGGAVVRLREDVSVEVLQRVMVACQLVSLPEGAFASAQVRSC
jgi:hypothetical protein